MRPYASVSRNRQTLLQRRSTTCSSLSTSAAWLAKPYTTVCLRILTYADVCWRMLTYAYRPLDSLFLSISPYIYIYIHMYVYMHIRVFVCVCVCKVWIWILRAWHWHGKMWKKNQYKKNRERESTVLREEERGGGTELTCREAHRHNFTRTHKHTHAHTHKTQTQNTRTHRDSDRAAPCALFPSQDARQRNVRCAASRGFSSVFSVLWHGML